MTAAFREIGTTMLCCIFNQAPLYRESVFRKIDSRYDAQFFFGYGSREPSRQGIAQTDFSIFKRPPRRFRVRSFGGHVPWYSGILHLPLSKRYSAFLVTGEFIWTWIPFLLLCGLTGKKFYAWGHGLKNADSFGALKRFFYRRTEKYFIYGEKGLERMLRLGFPASKFRVIYNSLCGRTFPAELPSEASDIYLRRFGNGDPVLIFSGRLVPAKRLDMLAAAVTALNASGCPCNAVLVGDGAERKKLEEAFRPVASRVWFYGECHDENILSELYRNAALCVSPGNAGLTAIHAMMYGCPVATHDDFETQMPEYEAVEDGKTGFLYAAGDARSLESGIRRWLENGPDRETVREECRKIIMEKWNSDSQIEIFAEEIGNVR